MLRATAVEARRILQDAVGKLDDPLHLRCTSSPGRAARLPTVPAPHTLREVGWVLGPLTRPPCLADYLVSRAQAALDAVSALEKGHAQYLTSRAGECHGHEPRTGRGRGQRPQAVVPTGHCCLRATSSGSHTLEPTHPLGLGSHRPWFGSCSAAL